MQTELPTILNVLETDYELEYSEIYTGTVYQETNRRISVLYLFIKSLWITIISKLHQFCINCGSYWCFYLL